MSPVKLQQALQDAGLGNRRLIRQLINEGKIKVNGTTASNPNFPVEPGRDKIYLRRKEIDIRPQPKAYYLFHKPKGVVSTLSDPQRRATVQDYIGRIRERVYPVGRLDYHSEGLMLLTNDGDLTNFILSARNRVPKTYLVKIKGKLRPETQKNLEKGFYLEGERLNPFQIEFVSDTTHDHSWLRVTITEGKKHILRKAFLFSGHPVEKLRRISIGTFRLKNLANGEWRVLTERELLRFRTEYMLNRPASVGVERKERKPLGPARLKKPRR